LLGHFFSHDGSVRVSTTQGSVLIPAEHPYKDQLVAGIYMSEQDFLSLVEEYMGPMGEDSSHTEILVGGEIRITRHGAYRKGVRIGPLYERVLRSYVDHKGKANEDDFIAIAALARLYDFHPQHHDQYYQMISSWSICHGEFGVLVGTWDPVTRRLTLAEPHMAVFQNGEQAYSVDPSDLDLSQPPDSYTHHGVLVYRVGVLPDVEPTPYKGRFLQLSRDIRSWNTRMWPEDDELEAGRRAG
jgi:hypothetical protein